MGRRGLTPSATPGRHGKRGLHNRAIEQVAAVLAIAQGEVGSFDVETLAGRFQRATRKRVDTIVGVLLDRRLLPRGDDGRLRSPGVA